MGVEIERKFLIKGEYKSLATSSSHIVQGYICRDSGRTVRIRIRDRKAYITIKGPALDGISRFEWEKEIEMADAEELILLSIGPVIDKTRYLVPFEGHTFEVDEFHGDNEGLTVAEVELSDPDEPFGKPSWLGEEVTGQKRYYNSCLTRSPFNTWDK